MSESDLPTAPRLFPDDAAIRRIGEGLLARSLPRADWTHEAHLAATTWLLRDRPDIAVDRSIATIISTYNESVGGVNDDRGGYHDTITRAFVVGIRTHLAARDPGEPIAACVNALLESPVGQRDWPLRFYSRALLFSVAARRGFVPPDLAPFPAPC
ncbi:hypothetical protein DBR17_18735 [Sphingomonas sp. HMWF008]|nr:hypothetical protein DBR17_18735 [Sphingomonas sp. HMWF008]